MSLYITYVLSLVSPSLRSMYYITLTWNGTKCITCASKAKCVILQQSKVHLSSCTIKYYTSKNLRHPSFGWEASVLEKESLNIDFSLL